MKKLIIIMIMLSLFVPGAVFAEENITNSEEIAEENMADNPAIQAAMKNILLDPSLFEDNENGSAMPAWLSYGFARLGWLMENKPNYLEDKNYQPTYKEELYGRESLAKVWMELKEIDPTLANPYLDAFEQIYTNGYLEEYVWGYLRSESWEGAPVAEERVLKFFDWIDKALPDHQSQTLVGLNFDTQ